MKSKKASASCDFLVVGSGLAGLVFALKAAELGKVLILSKESRGSGNTPLAQGGIAAVMADEDGFEQHVQDTLTAGAGLCNEAFVREAVEQAPRRIAELVDWGVQFDQSSQSRYSLTREGGHSHRRILHVEDHTGQEIHATLLKRVMEHPQIEFLEEHFAIDLILKKQIEPDYFGHDACAGAYVLDKQSNSVATILARATILATGGAGKVYLYTSNWSGATGDGVAMAYRAGARVANLEFMQFHPTCLYNPRSVNFLISEALRGEGGELVNQSGHAFMRDHHPLGSLAPRDIVARSIDAEMKKSGADCVYIDITHKPAEFIRSRFPAIYQKCLSLGIDITKEPIPVVPAAHYLCGGILTDKHGKTDIHGLFSIGETACTGLHGANRLASNSLLECLVTAHNATQFIAQHDEQFVIPNRQPPSWRLHDKHDRDEMIVIAHMWDEIRRLMWNYVGIVRTDRRLWRAQQRLLYLLSEIRTHYAHFRIHPDIIELRNIALVAALTVECALKRKESRGIHYNLDFPQTTAQWATDTRLNPATHTASELDL